MVLYAIYIYLNNSLYVLKVSQAQWGTIFLLLQPDDPVIS